MKNKVTFTFGFFYLFFTFVCGQGVARTSKDNLTLGVNLTGTGYYGDINYNQSGAAKTFNVLPGMEASISKKTKGYFSPLGRFGYGRIVAQNPDLTPFYFGPTTDPNSYYEPPRYVRTDFVYLDGAVKASPFRDSDQLLKPYASLGLGGMLFFPFKNDTIPFKGFNPLRGEKFSTITASLPLGLGTELNLSPKVNLNLGTTLRIPMNDYMDLYGANLIPNRKKGSDMLFSFAVGANFNLNTPEPVLANPPRYYIPPTQDALPVDTTILASADPNVMAIILRQSPDFMAAKDYSVTTGYPEGMIPLAVLAQSLECDSIARLYDQRISSLYNENLQLRSQYKKLNFELEQAIAEGNNGGGVDNVKTDSLIRIIYNKENKVRELEKQIAELSPAAPVTSLGESEKIAEYQKEIIALKQEVADLKSGATGGNETLGFTELQDKYNKLEEEKKSLDDQYAATQSQNAMMRKEIEDLRKSGSSGGPDLQAKVDSLIQENQRLLGDFEAMKKEYLVLRQDYDDLKASASDVAALRTQLNTLQTENTEFQAQTELLKKENDELKSQNLEDIKSKLDQATVYVDTMNVRYTRLQSVIENYESMLADAKRQNDDLELQIKQLQASAPSSNEADSVRTASFMAEIEELNMELTAERQQKKQFENDLSVANTRNKELEAENKTLKEGELDIAMSRIAVLEKENQELKSLNGMSNNQNDTLHQDSVLASSLYSQIEALKKDREELMTKNQELMRRMEISSASGTDSSSWVSRVAVVNHEKDSLQRVIDAFQTEQPEGSEQLLALQRENLQLKNENAAMLEVLEENKTAFAPMREKVAALETENASLGTEKQTLLAQITELQNTNTNLEKKISEVADASVTEQALNDTRTELDNVKREKENLSVEREKIISENTTLKFAVDSLNAIAMSTPMPSGVDSVKADAYLAQISVLKVQQDSLQRVIDAFSTENPDEQLTALQRENLQLKNENARMLEVLEGNKESFVPVREEMARLKDENIALSAEKSRLEQELALKSGTISCEELGLQVQQLEAENNLMRQQLAKSVVMQTQIVETQDLLVQKDITIANLQQKLTEVTVNSDVQEVVAIKDEEITTLTNQRNALQNKVDEVEKRLLVTENELNVALEKGGSPQLQAQVDALIEERDLYKKQYEEALAGTGTTPAPGTSPNVEKYQTQIAALETLNKQLSEENIKLREGASLPVENPDATALITKNEELTAEVARLNGVIAAKSEGNDGQVVAELNQQVSELTSENDNLRNQLKVQTSLTSGSVSEKDEMIMALNSKIAEKEDELLGARSQNNILVEERDRWKKLHDDIAGTGNPGSQPVVSGDDKDEQMLILKNQIAALTEENNKLKSQEPMPENEQLVALQQDVRVLTNRNEQLEEQIKDIQPAVENLMVENTSLKKELQTLKEEGAGSPKPNEEQNKQVVVLKKKLADAEEEIRNLMASKGEDLLVMYKEENDLFKQRINELQDENSNLKTQLENSGDGEIAILMQEKLELKEANETLKSEVEQLRNQPSSSGKEELIASLRGRIEAQDNEIQRLNDKVKNFSIPVSSEPSEYTKAEEAEALRKQNQELFDENESLRTALSNALNALYANQSAAAGVGNTAEYDRLKANYEQLMSEKTVLENQVLNLTEKLKTNMGTGDGDHDILVAQNSQLLDENTALKQRLSAISENPSSGSNPSSEELETLRKQNSDLNEEVIALQANVSRLNGEVEAYKNINVSAGGDPEIAKLMTENLTLKEQIEKNTEYVSNALDQHDKDLARIAELEQKVNSIPVVTVNTEDYDAQISSLKSENQNLKNQLAIAEQKGKNQPVASSTNPSSLNEAALSRRIAEVDARERRITQREEYIELKEEQLTLEDAKIKASAAREVELRLLEQDLKGFWDYQSDVMVDGSPCFPVSAFISKDEVMNRINDYFSAQGYKYQIIGGKMVYNNVIIPEIDPAKPVNIALYMMISSENNSKKVLQGAFQYAGDRTYITSDKYPAQSIRAVKLLQKVAQ